MQIKNTKSWSKYSRKQQYFFSTLALLLILFVESVAIPILGQFYPYAIIRFLAIFVGLRFGFAPSIYVLVSGTFLGNYFLVPPYGEITSPTQKDLYDWVVLFGTSILILFLIEVVQRQRYASELLRKVSDSRYQSLLHRENHRLILNRKLSDKSN
jgi:K+-sensing histidine kinase KdpD